MDLVVEHASGGGRLKTIGPRSTWNFDKSSFICRDVSSVNNSTIWCGDFVVMLPESRNTISPIVVDSGNSVMNHPKVPAEGVGIVRGVYQSLKQFVTHLSAVDVHD